MGIGRAFSLTDLSLKNRAVLPLAELLDALLVLGRVGRSEPAAGIVAAPYTHAAPVLGIDVPDRDEGVAVALRPHLARLTPEGAFDVERNSHWIIHFVLL